MLFFSGIQKAYSQLGERLYTTDYKIDPLYKNQLSVEVDNLSFFKDNEFNSTVQRGYTLPGFWLQLKAVYYPLSNIKIEAGAHSIWYWGTTRYPAFAYRGIPEYGGKDYLHNVHVLPFFRAQVSLSDNIDVVLGNIYGGANHGLIEPLYNPELNLSSDPEKGAQLLYKSKWVESDLWIDWITFIYNLDTHQEAFAAGNTTRFKLNVPESRIHMYVPIQGLAYHKGGEIDVTNIVAQTIMNGSLGAGLRWNINRRILDYINAEFDVAGYIYPKGSTDTFKRGRGYYSKVSALLKDFNISMSYWSCKDFVSVFGNTFYSSTTTREEYKGMIFEKPKMLNFCVDYSRSFGKGFAFGANVEAYYNLSGKLYSPETGMYQSSAFGKNTNFSLGVYMRMNTSFLIKQY